MPKSYPQKALTRTLLATAATLSLAAAAHAVIPGQFTQTTEADFADGDAYGTVVTNLGDIKLSSDTTELEGLPEDVTVIHDVVKVGDATYIAAGPEAKILKLTDKNVEVVAEAETLGDQFFCLTAHKDTVLIGVSGKFTRIAAIKDDRFVNVIGIASDDGQGDTRYIWDLITQGSDLIVATGGPGQVVKIPNIQETIDKVGTFESPGLTTTLLETTQANILSLAADNAGNIYAGTDTDGLIYRIDKHGNPFVIYDAAEAEVATLVAMPDGTLYAGTAAADQAKPGRLAKPVKEETGRPAAPKTPEPSEAKPDQAEQPAAATDASAEDTPADKPEGTATEPATTDQPAEDAAPAKPTGEQYDELRQTLKERLEAARESGQLDAATDTPAVKQPNAAGSARKANRPSRAKPAAPKKKKPGNAIYQIAPDGFVTEVFRESAMILAIVPNNDKLIVATGNEGQVFSVDPQRRETTVLADLDSTQVTCAIPTNQGLLLGAANPGTLTRMNLAVADNGQYTSKVLDAGQVSIFGTFKLTADIPSNTTVAIELRSGNVGDPEQAAWSKWTPATLIKHQDNANPLQPREIKVDVPPARYLQYRLTLKGDGKATPVIDQTDLAFVAPNTPPTVTKLAIKAAPVKAPGTDPNPKLQLQWQATDANRDRLVYSLEYKPGKADRYLPLAEDLTAPKYDWQTQHVPDGWYTLRVTAHDKLDNPADAAKSAGRVSEPILIDNTDPTLDGLTAKVLGNGKVKLTATAEDELSAIRSVAYSIDGAEQYHASLPDDLIYDSTNEPWGVTISDLSPGGHVIAVRVIDAKGNTAYRQLIVDVK